MPKDNPKLAHLPIEEMHYFGIPIAEMSRDDLMRILCFASKQYHNHLKTSLEDRLRLAGLYRKLA